MLLINLSLVNVLLYRSAEKKLCFGLSSIELTFANTTSNRQIWGWHKPGTACPHGQCVCVINMNSFPLAIAVALAALNNEPTDNSVRIILPNANSCNDFALLPNGPSVVYPHGFSEIAKQMTTSHRVEQLMCALSHFSYSKERMCRLVAKRFDIFLNKLKLTQLVSDSPWHSIFHWRESKKSQSYCNTKLWYILYI